MSLDVVCDEFNDCAWNVCLYSSFLISVCMFIVSKALLISSATVIVRTGGICVFVGFEIGTMLANFHV